MIQITSALFSRQNIVCTDFQLADIRMSFPSEFVCARESMNWHWWWIYPPLCQHSYSRCFPNNCGPQMIHSQYYCRLLVWNIFPACFRNWLLILLGGLVDDFDPYNWLDINTPTINTPNNCVPLGSRVPRCTAGASAIDWPTFGHSDTGLFRKRAEWNVLNQI